MLPGANIRQRLTHPTRPFDFEPRNVLVLTQPESKSQFAGGEVAGAAMYSLPLRTSSAGYPNHCADPIAVAAGSLQFHAQPMIGVSTVVAIEVGGAVIGGDQHVQIAVAVEITIRRSARHHRGWKRVHFLKRPVALIPQQERRLLVADPWLHALDLLIQVAVGGEDIRVPVQV